MLATPLGSPNPPVTPPMTPAILWLAAAFVLLMLAWPLLIHRQYHSIQHQLDDDVYQDDNGRATTESIRRFNRGTVCWLIVGSAAVQVCSSALLLLSSFKAEPNLVSFQTLQITFATLGMGHSLFSQFFSSPLSRTWNIAYGLCINALSLGITTILATEPFTPGRVRPVSPMTYTAVIIQLASGLLSSACYVSLPRRPDVYLDGMLVDRQNCSSAWSAITFSWANDLLQLALTKQSINVEDLPKLPRVARSAYLQPRLDGVHPSRSLLARIVLVHWPAILLQQILTVAVVCLNFAPQVILLYILRCLESLQSSNSSRVPALAGAMALSSCMVVSSVVDSWLYWLVVYRISIPLREQLSSVIYAKAIRSPVLKSSSRGVPQSKGDASDCETEEAPALDENTINLVAVDSKRVSDQAANNYTITSTFLKFVVACVFLILLLGWVSTLSGLCLVMAITPLNFWLSQRLARSQTTMMGHRDQRVAVLGEVLRGIRQVKLRAHENWWEARISILRRSELRARWMCFLYDLGLMTVCALGPILLSVVSLGIYAVVDGPLTPSVAFSAMGAFASLEASIANLPELVASLIEALVSLRRIGNYLALPDFQSPVLPSTTGSISFKGAAIAYKADVDMPLQERFVLNNLDFSFPPRALSIVSGKTGSGKSLILSAIMGECEVIRGAVQVPDNGQRNPSTEQSGEEPWIMDTAIAFVPQIPWMDNATVQDNILFGLPYHQSRYQQVISDCSLTEDINSFPQKHLTKVGAHGIHLSGGQKWRLSLARALYSRAGILLLEDIFSAVDVRTALVICDRALTGPLAQGRTRILVTHHLDLCKSRADFVMELGNGEGELACHSQLSSSGQSLSSSSTNTKTNSEDAMPKVEEVLAASQYVNKFDAPTGLKIDESEMERNATGWVEMKVYERYLKTGGDGRLWSLIFLSYISYMILILSRPWWINIWTRDITSTDNLRSPVNQSMVVLDREQSHLAGDVGYYLSVYILISVLSCIAGPIRFFFIFSASLRASRELFNQLLFSVLNAPVEWFDHVPVGRILNRFSTDINLIDSKLGYDIGAMIHRFLEVMGIAISGLFATPLTAIFSLIPIVGGVYYAPRYLVAARDIKRLESSTMSPVLEHFGTSISGLMTIRAFGNITWFISRMQMLLDRHGQASWHLWLFNRWFNLRMSLIGAIYCALTATLVVLLPGINASIAGFVLSFTIQYPNAVLWSVRQYINVELSMSSTERVMEYENMVIEDQGGVEPPAAWPDAGMLEVQDLSVGYGNLPCVLKGVSFKVGPAEKVAVVGKTGAGKSSLTYAIFRVLEARKGSVLIDGVDISKLRLKELRSRIHIIPQDPIFFSGTIRSNLDPQNQYSDQEMYECLQGLQLFDSDAQSANIMAKEKSYFADLSNTVSANGEGLSFGQRQLLSLCRAFLSRPKLLVFDEATSSLDMATDALIQKFIRQQAARFGTTLLVVAHRLSTVIDFDKIIVFDSGRVVESGPAHELINIDNGVFRSMIEISVDRAKLKELISQF